MLGGEMLRKYELHPSVMLYLYVGVLRAQAVIKSDGTLNGAPCQGYM